MSALFRLRPSDLRTRIVGCRIEVYESLTSTNEFASRLGREGAPDGTAVFALEQASGHGRFGRVWHSPRGGLWCSVLMRPTFAAQEMLLITAVGALAAREAAAHLGVGDARIRFPNDVYARGRKLAGVLAESRFAGSEPEFFVLGTGLNVNLCAEHFPPELTALATSVQIEAGRETPLAVAARTLLEVLDEWYTALRDGAIEEIVEEWRNQSDLIGRRVRIEEESRAVEGIVEDVHPLDGIQLRLDAGPVARIAPDRIAAVRLG